MKKICKTCEHRCHCVGQGYNVSTNKCDNCICDHCTCGGIVLGSKIKKSLWQKIKDWLF
jgi:hypothetical protein